MSQQRNSRSLLAPQQPVPAFQSLLAIGAMLATLAVVCYASVHSDDSAVRVAIVLQGAKVILLTWIAGFIASAVHHLSLIGEAAPEQRFARG